MSYPALPFDMIEEILGFLHDDPSTLKSNALVSRMFRHFAHQLLFHRIVLKEDPFDQPELNELSFDSSIGGVTARRARRLSPVSKCGSACPLHATGSPRPRYQVPDLMFNNDVHKTPMCSTRCIELARLLDSDPHLASYIRVLHIRSRPEDLSGGNDHWFINPAGAPLSAPEPASCSYYADEDGFEVHASEILPSLLQRLTSLSAIKFDAKYDWRLLPSPLRASLFWAFQKPGLKAVDLGHLEVLDTSLFEYLTGVERIGVSFQVANGPKGVELPLPQSSQPQDQDQGHDDTPQSRVDNDQLQPRHNGEQLYRRRQESYQASPLKALHVTWGGRLPVDPFIDQDHGILNYLDVSEVEELMLSGPFTPATYALVEACSRTLRRLNLVNYTSWRPITGLSLDSPIAIDLSTLPLLHTLSLACTASEWGVLRLFTHLLSTSPPTNSALSFINITFSGGLPYAPADQWNAFDIVLAGLAFVGGLREVRVKIEKGDDEEYLDLYGRMNINVLKRELMQMLPLLRERGILVVA